MKRLCLLIPLLAAIAAADPLVFSDVSVFTTITADNSIPSTSHYGYLPIGSPIEIEVFGTIPAWSKFTIERNNPHSSSFMSAMGNAGGQMGVGKSDARQAGVGPDIKRPGVEAGRVGNGDALILRRLARSSDQNLDLIRRRRSRSHDLKI